MQHGSPICVASHGSLAACGGRNQHAWRVNQGNITSPVSHHHQSWLEVGARARGPPCRFGNIIYMLIQHMASHLMAPHVCGDRSSTGLAPGVQASAIYVSYHSEHLHSLEAQVIRIVCWLLEFDLGNYASDHFARCVGMCGMALPSRPPPISFQFIYHEGIKSPLTSRHLTVVSTEHFARWRPSPPIHLRVIINHFITCYTACRGTPARS